MATKEFGSQSTGDNTVVGESILISGKLTGDEDLTVRGRVEGELTLSKTLIVEVSGVVKANVAVRNAIVSGVVVGNINATESVELTREGRMVGDIRAPRVIIVDGASFRGRVDMGDVEPGRLPAERPQRPVVRPVSTSRPTSTPVAAPARPAAPVAAPSRPQPPPPPAKVDASRRPELQARKPEGKPLPPPKPESKPQPPSPPQVALAAKKKVLLKKK